MSDNNFFSNESFEEFLKNSSFFSEAPDSSDVPPVQDTPMQVPPVSDPFATAPVQSDPFAQTSVQPDPFAQTTVQSDPFAQTPVQSDPFAQTSVQPDPFAQTTVQSDPFAQTTVQSDPFAQTPVQPDPFAQTTVQSDPFAQTTVQSDPFAQATEQPDPFATSFGTQTASVSEPAPQAKKACELISSMENWQLSMGKESYLNFKHTMIGIIAEIEKAFKEETESYNMKKENAKLDHDKAISNLRKRLLTIPDEEADKEFKSFVESLNNSWTGPTGYKTNTEQAISKFQFVFRDDSLVHSIASKIISSKDKAELDSLSQQIASVRSQSLVVEGKMKRAIDVAFELKQAKQAYNKKVCNDAVEEENYKFSNEIELIENEHRNTVANIVNSITPLFRKIFNRDNILKNNDISLRVLKPSSNYTFSTKIPQHLYLGKRSFSVEPSGDMFVPELVTLFGEINHDDVIVTSEKITFRLPYTQSMQEGYSIFVESITSESETSKNVVKSYATKILMNYPAGQTRPLFLDSNTQITCFTKIGDNSRRGLITKPWSKPEDIENEISKVAEEGANLSVSYGSDIESRLRREPLYFICARNFPMSFTTKSITDMAKIFLSGTKNGFFGIIEADSKEITNRVNDTAVESALATIKSNSFCLIETSPDTFVVNDGSRDEFHFDFAQLSCIEDSQISSSIIKGYTDYSREIEKFEYLFAKDAGNVDGTIVEDVNTWFRGSAMSNYEVPIGIMGASTVQKFVVEGVAQHALISGITGSGKSTLLRTIIVSSMIKFDPDQINFYLIDYKEGVEFAAFANYRLPWIKVIALDTKREFALNILRDLQTEFEKRAEEMRDATTTRVDQLGHNRFPRIVLIFDEVQELLREHDHITDECINILAKLVSEGRAMNMNVILASQNFSICNGMEQLMANMAIRIAFKGSPESVSKIMGNDFSYAQLETGDSGYAAINSASGAKGNTHFFQAGYLDEAGRNEILGTLQMARASRDCTTRVMSSRINQDRNNKFNRLISNNDVDYTENPDCYDLIIGDEFNLGGNKSISMSTKEGENFIIVGDDESVAKSIFSLTMLSVLYDELASKAHRIDNELIRIIDLSDERHPHSEYFSFMKQQFSSQVNIVDILGVDRMIEDTYDNLMLRKSGEIDCSERLFFMIFGIDSSTNLQQEIFSDDDIELSLQQKLEKIIKDGPMYGINSVIWTRSYSIFKKIVSPACAERYINKRIFFGSEQEECTSLTGRNPVDSVKKNEAVMFRDVSHTGISVFKPYTIPKKEWVMKIAETYKEFEESMNN